MQWISLGQISLIGTLLIMMVLIIRSLNKQKKLSHGAILLLWQIVLIRLLLPVSIPSSISPLNNVGAIKDLFFLNTSQEVTSSISFTPAEMLSEGPPSPSSLSNQVQPLTLSQLLTFIWLLGMLGLMGRFIVLSYRSHRVLKEALPIKNLAPSISYLQRNKRAITLLVSDRLSTPITYGLLKPKIIFPKSMSHSPKELHYVLTHEMIHIQYCHVLWKKAALLLVCIYWFNPLVWLMYHFINKDIELACDEKVLKQLGQDEKECYALSLLHLAAKEKSFWTLSSAFGKNAIEERIISIMKKRNTSLLVTLSILTLSLTATCLSATTYIPTKNQATQQTTPSSNSNLSWSHSVGSDMASEFKDYEQYGLTYKVDEDSYYYNNQKVKLFVDKLFPNKDTVKMFTRPDGTICIKAIRDKKNQLTGLKQVTSDELDSLFTGSSEDIASLSPEDLTPEAEELGELPGKNEPLSISSATEGDAPSEMPSETPNAKEAYTPYGVTYNKSNDTWKMNGQIISLLYDEGYHTYINNSKEARENGVKLQVIRNQDHTIHSIDILTEKELTQLKKKVPFLKNAL